jgi:hypothetical protein
MMKVLQVIRFFNGVILKNHCLGSIVLYWVKVFMMENKVHW